MNHNFYAVFLCVCFNSLFEVTGNEDGIEIIDMTRPTNWKDLSAYYNAVEKRWKLCLNCGYPAIGTAMHLEHAVSMGSMLPAIIPSEYMLTRLAIIDVSAHTAHKVDFVLTLDVALQWLVLKHDPREPTLLLFKFGWKADQYYSKIMTCICKIPGISYELAEWIATNLTHVVGVATDAPTLESEQTREFAVRTVANMLGKSGIYMIENVNIRKPMPEQGCMAISMPMKLLNINNVPTRLTAFCPTTKTDMNVVIALRNVGTKHIAQSRIYDVNMDEILN